MRFPQPILLARKRAGNIRMGKQCDAVVIISDTDLPRGYPCEVTPLGRRRSGSSS
jgi:hypothetical protein